MKSRNGDNSFIKSRPRWFYGYYIVAAAFLIHFISFSLNDSYGVLVYPWVNDFGWSRATISGAYSVSFFVMGMVGLLAGIITDKYGPRITLSFCAVSLGAGYLLLSQMHTSWHLYLFYGLIFGTGMSGVWAPILSLISRWFATRRGLVTGIVISGGGIGAFIGPPVITGLIETYGWKHSTMILGSFVLVSILLAAQFLKRDPSQAGQLPFGENKTFMPEAEAVNNDFSCQDAVRTAQFWVIFFMFFCLAFYTFSILVHLIPHAVQLGIPDMSAAYILGTISGASIIGNYIMGLVCDKIGPRQVFIISFLLMSAALFWLVQSNEIWMLYLFSVIFGFNHGGNATAQSPLLARIFGLKAIGTIFGLATLGFTIGGAAGPLVTGYIFDLTGSYLTAFLLSAAIGLAGLASTALLRPTQRIKTKI